MLAIWWAVVTAAVFGVVATYVVSIVGVWLALLHVAWQCLVICGVGVWGEDGSCSALAQVI